VLVDQGNRKWRGVHRGKVKAGRHKQRTMPWHRRAGLAAIGAAALVVFPLSNSVVERPQFVGPIAMDKAPTPVNPIKPDRNPPRITERKPAPLASSYKPKLASVIVPTPVPAPVKKRVLAKPVPAKIEVAEDPPAIVDDPVLVNPPPVVVDDPPAVIVEEVTPWQEAKEKAKQRKAALRKPKTREKP
jgi:hypothetical protein